MIRSTGLPPWLLRLSPLLLAGALGASMACSESTAGPDGSTCCRVCSTGKACGDSCIAKNLTCRVGPGCACNAAIIE